MTLSDSMQTPKDFYTLYRFNFYVGEFGITAKKVESDPSRYTAFNGRGNAITEDMSAKELIAWAIGFKAGFRARKCKEDK